MAIELATAYVSIVPSAKGFAGNLQTEIAGDMRKVGTEAGQQVAAGVSSKIGGALKGVGAVVGGTLVANQAFSFLGGAVDQASSLNETLSKTRSVFGPASGDIEKWAAGAASAIGQSRQQALDAASSFGNLFVQLGIGAPQAAKLSKSMTGLASDFASFHNADITEVINAQQAAFRGEYDSLQRFVPTINAAAVEQEALRQTGKSATKELTAQEKALAVNALMMKGAGDAAGDFARTSDSLANRQRIQAAQWDNLRATIGQALVPVLAKLTAIATKITDFLAKHSSLIGPLAAVIGGALVTAFGLWAASALAAASATILAALPIVALGAAIAAVAVLFVKHWDTIKGAVSAAFRWIKQHIDLILVVALGPLGAAIALLRNNWDTVWGAVSGAVSKAWDIIRPIIKLIREAIEKIAGPIKTVVGAVGKLGGAVGGTVGKVGGLLGFDAGGVVPGPIGAPRVVLAHGGETILPTHKSGFGAGVRFGDVNIDARGIDDPAAVGDYTSRMIGWRLALAGGI